MSGGSAEAALSLSLSLSFLSCFVTLLPPRKSLPMLKMHVKTMSPRKRFRSSLGRDRVFASAVCGAMTSPRVTFSASRVDQGRHDQTDDDLTEAKNNNNINKRPTMIANSVRTAFAIIAIAALATVALARPQAAVPAPRLPQVLGGRKLHFLGFGGGGGGGQATQPRGSGQGWGGSWWGGGDDNYCKGKNEQLQPDGSCVSVQLGVLLDEVIDDSSSWGDSSWGGSTPQQSAWGADQSSTSNAGSGQWWGWPRASSDAGGEQWWNSQPQPEPQPQPQQQPNYGDCRAKSRARSSRAPTCATSRARHRVRGRQSPI